MKGRDLNREIDMTNEDEKNPVGRPKFDIDWKEVEKMVMAGCKGTEVAATLGIGVSCLYKRCEEENNINFSHFLREKRAKGDQLLRIKQFGIAMQGDRGMLIWLGKQRLGQSEKKEIEHSSAAPVHIVNWGDEEPRKWSDSSDESDED